MQKNLIVTLATKNYVLLAKQLFSSVYFNAGWKGDYMLLACQIPEKDLKWFRKQGILIRKCRPFYLKITRRKRVLNARVTTLKFQLFKPEFKKWKNIIYLDADIIVRASLDALTKVKRFAVVPDSAGPLSNQFVKETEKNKIIFKKLRKKYNLNTPSFNSGVMAFNTDIINKNTFFLLKALINEYEKIRITSDQMCLNLLFYKKWQKLPFVYNSLLFVFKTIVRISIQKKRVKTIVLHFAANGFHDVLDSRLQNILYKEWRENLCKAEFINLNNVLPAKAVWKYKKINKFQRKYKKIYKKYLQVYKKQRIALSKID